MAALLNICHLTHAGDNGSQGCFRLRQLHLAYERQWGHMRCHEQGFRWHLPQANNPVAPGQDRGSVKSVHLMETRIVCPSAPPDIQYHAFHIQTIGGCQTRHVLEHAPWHRHMAPTALKLYMHQQCSAVRQGDLKHLIHRHSHRWQFTLERTGALHRSAEKPGSKVENKGAYKPFEETIGFCHRRSSPLLQEALPALPGAEMLFLPAPAF